MHNYYKVLLVCFIVFLIICLYGNYRCMNPEYHDPLMRKLGVGDLDGWSIAHLIFFMVLGYMYPDTFLVAMGLGVGWEAFEHFLGKQRPGFLGGFGDCITTDPALEGPWWFGRLSDIGMNMFGFLLGAYFRQRFA